MKKTTLLIIAGFSFLCSYSQSSTAAKSVFAQNVDAISSLAWPVLTLIIFIALYSHIKRIIRSRSFSIKVAGMEVNVQNMADQLSKQIHELQNKTIELACEIEKIPGKHHEDLNGVKQVDTRKWRVLWVTGNHESHAFEIANLEEDGIEVMRAKSTDEAMEILISQPANIDGIVTGVVRKENNKLNLKAGLELIKKVKAGEFKIPVFVLCSERNIKQYYSALKEAGAIEATSSSLRLLGLLKEAGINCSRQLPSKNLKPASSSVIETETGKQAIAGI